MRIRKDETGNKYGKLTVLEYLGKKKYKCLCDCGNTVDVYTDNLRSGKTKSCGCERFSKSNYKDLTGQRFGRLVAKKYLKNSNWLCICDCGNEIITKADYLKSGNTKSCGCLSEEQKTYSKYKDDIRAKSLYKKWQGMKERCYSPSHDSYIHYGAKGIKVCDEWKDSFENFYKWAIEHGYEEITSSYKDRLAIDRIDSSKDYCPENCRFISISENSSRVSEVNQQLEELNRKSEDEMVQEYIQRKMEHNQEIQAEKKRIRSGGFFVRKNNYCVLSHIDGQKQFLFKSFKVVAMFLNISQSAVSYRFKHKNGKLTDEWKIQKITKEEFDNIRRKNVEVII